MDWISYWTDYWTHFLTTKIQLTEMSAGYEMDTKILTEAKRKSIETAYMQSEGSETACLELAWLLDICMYMQSP